NNILEQFFRGMRRSYRRATGNNSMCKKRFTPDITNRYAPKVIIAIEVSKIIYVLKSKSIVVC
ncbi:MAG: hypothetical protein WD577_02495, partial [Bacteroidales bacterium]